MVFNKEFDSVLSDASYKFRQKAKSYSDSWKTMEIGSLCIRLAGEYDEFGRAERQDNFKEMYKELLDVINMSLMLAKRLADLEEKVNTR